MSNPDETDDFPSVSLGVNGREYSDVTVLEGDDTLAGLIAGPNVSCSNLYLWNSEYSRSYVVISGSEQAALDWLADFGVLDGMRVSEEDEMEQIEEHGRVLDAVRLGNAGEPFVLEMCRIRKVWLSDLTYICSQLTFGRDGWMHIWASGPDDGRPPYQDVVLQLDDDFKVATAWSPQGTHYMEEEYLQDLAERRIWRLVEEHC